MPQVSPAGYNTLASSCPRKHLFAHGAWTKRAAGAGQSGRPARVTRRASRTVPVPDAGGRCDVPPCTDRPPVTHGAATSPRGVSITTGAGSAELSPAITSTAGSSAALFRLSVMGCLAASILVLRDGQRCGGALLAGAASIGFLACRATAA